MSDQVPTKTKAPAFQLYAAEFLADENVVLMSNQEVGCYIKLMCYCWREGSIPSEIDKLAKLCGESGSAMGQLWQSLSLCFVASTKEPSRLVHPRLERERIKIEEFKKERAESGSKGAKARWNKELPSGGSAKEQLLANDSFSSSSSFSTSVNKKKAKPARDLIRPVLLQDGLPEHLADELIEHRKKHPLTERAWEGIKREIGKARMTLPQGVIYMLEKQWRGFEAAWVNGSSGPRFEKYDPLAFVNRPRFSQTQPGEKVVSGEVLHGD